MKVAIYIEDSVTQVVLTPQTKREEEVLGLVEENKSRIRFRRGSFYHCRGGWWRQGDDDTSLMLVIDKDVDKNSAEGPGV